MQLLLVPPSVSGLLVKSISKGYTSIVPLLVLSMHIESTHIAADQTQIIVSMSKARYGTVNLRNVKGCKLVYPTELFYAPLPLSGLSICMSLRLIIAITKYCVLPGLGIASIK